MLIYLRCRHGFENAVKAWTAGDVANVLVARVCCRRRRLRLVLSRRHAAIYDISETASVVRWVAVRKAAALHRHRGLANRRGHRIVTYWAEGGGGEALKWALPCAPD